MAFREELAEEANKVGIDLVGVTSADKVTELEERLYHRQAEGIICPWEERAVAARCTPRLNAPFARSIVVVAISYYYPVVYSSPGLTGRIAHVGRGIDYHVRLREALGKLVPFVRRWGVEDYHIQVDTGPLVEREFAWRAGIGWLGKNAAITTPGKGSFLALGLLLVDVEFPGDQGSLAPCGQCRRCLLSCPTGALRAPHEVDPRRCLSFMTQSKGFIPVDMRSKMGDRIYGCDTCQEACPFNGQLSPGQAAFRLGGKYPPSLADIVALDTRRFQIEWGHSALAWRGLNVLRRNAVVALGNTGNAEALPVLGEALQMSSPVVRGHAAWAIGEIGGKEARKKLILALDRESDCRARGEIEAALISIS